MYVANVSLVDTLLYFNVISLIRAQLQDQDHHSDDATTNKKSIYCYYYVADICEK